MSSEPAGWPAETALDPTIEFHRPLAEHAGAPQRIFLTGATGFLGAFLLAELVQQTAAQVYCLVRAERTGTGAQRLQAHLRQLGLWSTELARRIVPVTGDLALPRLGLAEREFDALAEQLDTIFHNGGLVNFVRPYAALKPANVLGTQEILRLAGTATTKPVHYTSSLAIFFSRDPPPTGPISELDTPALDWAASSGYTQSKWVAEQLVLAARARGLPATIYRTARITGHSQTGATSNWKDLLNSFLKGCIVLGAYPAAGGELAMVPVDYISRAMVHLAQQPRSRGRAFHFFQPQPIPLADLMSLVRGAGYALTELEYGAWLAALKQLVSAAHPERETLAQLWFLLSGPNYLFAKKPCYETPNLQEGLRGTSIACHPIDETLVGRYLAFFQQRGYIPPPIR